MVVVKPRTKIGLLNVLTNYNMAIYLSFHVEGEKQISRRLNLMKVKKFKNAFDRIGRQLVQFYSSAVFSSEGAVIGEKWPNGPQYHRLQRTGAMRSSFRHRATEEQLVVENTASYFRYHQSNRPRHKLPRRVMIKLDNPRKQLVVREIQKEYFDELKRR